MKSGNMRRGQNNGFLGRLALLIHALACKECRICRRDVVQSLRGLDYEVPESLRSKVTVDAVTAASLRARATSSHAQVREGNPMRSDETGKPEMDKAFPMLSPMRPVLTRPRIHKRPAFLAAGIGLVVLIILSVFAGIRGNIANADPLVVIAMSGKVEKSNGQFCKLGDKIPIGTVLSTGKDSRATLITRKGTQICLDSHTRYRLASATGTEIISGRAFLSNRMGEIKQIATPAGRVQLLGTQVDTSVLPSKAVAVTVVSGKVRLQNSGGDLMVGAGRRAVFTAQNVPASPVSVDVAAETAWYDGRGNIVSDFGQIAYLVERADSPISEIWAMNADGSGKHRLKSLVGNIQPGNWLSGQQWLKLDGFASLCWNAPDHKTRKASGRSGSPIFWGMPVTTINAATGQDCVLELPRGLSPWISVLSPDGNYLALINGLTDGKSKEIGLWVCSLRTGEVRQLLKGRLNSTPAWAPDSRRIAISNADGYANQYNMVIVDAETREIDDLGFSGEGAAFSPDGTKLACVGDFDHEGNGSVLILDLQNSRDPVRVTDGLERPLALRWSPDGSRLMYYIRKVDWVKNRSSHGAVLPESYSVKTVNTDGSGSRTVFREDLRMPLVRGCEWADDGRSIYVRKAGSVLVIASDGSGVIADLGGDASDSILSARERVQTNAAAKAIEEAVFQYAVGENRTYEGRVREARSAYRASSDIWSSLVWDYPLANLSVSNIQLYADKAAKKAAMTDKELMGASCRQRLSFMETRLELYLGKEKAFPPDLETLREWGYGGAIINWMNFKEDVDKVALIFRCPETGELYQYRAPNPATMKVGDALAVCPNHPDSEMRITGCMLNCLKK